MKSLSKILVTRNTWLVCHLVVSILILFAVLMSLSSINTYISLHIEQPSFFKSREYFSKSPKLYDKLKIIAYDDLSFSYYGGPRLPSDDLFTLIKNLEKRNPKAILIDSLLSDNTEKTDNTTYTSNTTFSGAFLNAQKIPYRKEISEKS